MKEKDVAVDACLVVAGAKENIATINGSVLVQGVAIIQTQLRAAIIFVQLDVNHAGNRVRPRSGRSAIFQNFNALHGRKWNGVQVEEAGASWIRRDTAAID